MTTDDRVAAVEAFGFTRRQAAFLVTVMCQAGVCLPRQYAAFAGIAYGHKINRFFDRLVARGIASASPCLHNRARVYHVHHRALYGAIGQPHSRFRRPVPAASVMPRLMLLDAILDSPEEVVWLQTAREQVVHFTKRLGVPADRLPRQVRRRGHHESYRPFPDGLPVGLDPSARPVFIFPKTESALSDLRPFLRRHRALWTDLSTWTLRLVFPPGEYLSDSLWKAPLQEEIGELLDSTGEAHRRVESMQLRHRYDHLSPLVAWPAWTSAGVERGEQVGERWPTRPQPPRRPGTYASRRRRAVARTTTLRCNNSWPCLL